MPVSFQIHPRMEKLHCSRTTRSKMSMYVSQLQTNTIIRASGTPYSPFYCNSGLAYSRLIDLYSEISVKIERLLANNKMWTIDWFVDGQNATSTFLGSTKYGTTSNSWCRYVGLFYGVLSLHECSSFALFGICVCKNMHE